MSVLYYDCEVVYLGGRDYAVRRIVASICGKGKGKCLSAGVSVRRFQMPARILVWFSLPLSPFFYFSFLFVAGVG
jgi:hypothetical protein